MSSVDELVVSIVASVEAAEHVSAMHAAADAIAEELHGQLSAVGAEGKASEVTDLRSRIAEQMSASTALLQSLERARIQADALRGEAGASGSSRTGPARGGGSVPKPTKSHGAQQKRAGVMQGPVKFSAPRKLEGQLTAEHRRQVQEYVDAANRALAEGKLSGSGRVRPSQDPTLKNAKEAAAAKERVRAEAAGEPYGDLVAAHLPDTTWSGTADPPGGWGRHYASINASLGSQSDKYPDGYQPKQFMLDESWNTVDTEGGDGE